MPHILSTLILFGLLPLAALSTPTPDPSDRTILISPREPNCVTGLHIVIQTGIDASTKNPADAVESGDLTTLANDIASAIPDSEVEKVEYTFTSLNINSTFLEAVDTGTVAFKQHIENYVDTCGSDSKIALLGFAQGALIATDAYIGSGANQHVGDGYPPDWMDVQWSAGVGALSEEYTDRIVAAAVFSSPTAFSQMGYSRGTALSNGMFASARGPLSVSGEKFRSWCDEGDFMCAAVSMGVPVGSHTKTVAHYKDAAKEFIVGAWEKATGGGNSE